MLQIVWYFCGFFYYSQQVTSLWRNLNKMNDVDNNRMNCKELLKLRQHWVTSDRLLCVVVVFRHIFT